MDQSVQLTSRLAPAKINLALHVTGRRADGYHLLESLVVFTRFGDRLSVEPAEADEFVVTGPFAGQVPTDGGNLVIAARDRLRVFSAQHESASGSFAPPSGLPTRPTIVPSPVLIRLEKNLPVASGIGGGSSDAAAALTALATLWAPGLPQKHLHDIGLTLGADVPMCLEARPLIARGVGEALSPVANFPALGLVLVNPGVPVSTAGVFSVLASRDNPPLPPLPRHFDFHSIRNWLETTRNDLEAPARALEPSIGAALAALEKAGSGFSRMSGSGGTCFGLFETGNVAKRAAAAIRSRHPNWFVAATRSIASEAEE